MNLQEATILVLQGKLEESINKENFSDEFFKILELNNLYVYEDTDKLIITNKSQENLSSSMYFDSNLVGNFYAISNNKLFVDDKEYNDIYEAIKAFYKSLKNEVDYYNYGPNGTDEPAYPFFRYNIPNVKKLDGSKEDTVDTSDIIDNSKYNVDFTQKVYIVSPQDEKVLLKPKEIQWFENCEKLGIKLPIAISGFWWVRQNLQKKSPAYVNKNAGEAYDYISWNRILNTDRNKDNPKLNILAILQNPNATINDTTYKDYHLSN